MSSRAEAASGRVAMQRLSMRMMVLAALAMVAAGCDQKPAAPPAAPAAAVALAPAPSAAPLPGATAAAPIVATAPTAPPAPTMPALDVGKLDTVKVSADGFGATASEAVGEAIRLAILQ